MPTLVSHLGLANVPEPRLALRELRRVGEELVATHVFYPEDDDANREVARGLGLDELLFRESALHAFEESGWKVEVETAAEVAAAPTPASALIEGVRIDALPAAPTRALWCVVHAR